MAERVFKTNFAVGFAGIDGQQSALEPEGNHVNRAVNLEMSVGNSLRGRTGCQIAGGTGHFFGLFPWRYTRTQDQYAIKYQVAAGVYPTQTAHLSTTKTSADGASLQKLIGLNQQVWVRDTIDVTVTYVSGTYPFTWYTYVSGSNINFVIKANAVSILDTSLGDGLTSSTTIYSLLNTIDALAQLSISTSTRGTCPPFAIVNGSQTAALVGSTIYGTAYTLTVAAGHNFTSGDIISFPPASLSAFVNSEDFIGGFVTTSTATTITYVGTQVSVLNNAVLGYMGQVATGFDITTVQTASAGNLAMSFPYWRLIPEGVDATFGHPFYSAQNQWQNRSTDSWYAPPVAENASGDLYIAASSQVSSGTSTIANNLVKMDGQTLVRAGLPAPAISLTNTGAGNILSGVKYKCYLKRYDAQGNIVEGPLSNIVTTTANARYYTVTVAGYLYSSAFGFQGRSAFKRTAEAPAAGQFFYVDDNNATGGGALAAFLQPGDPICYIESTTAQHPNLWFNSGLTVNVGTLHRTVCTDYCASVATISPTATSIRVADSSGVTIPDDSPITNGLTCVILRTTQSGNQYYTLAEIPYTGYASAVIYDNVLDADLITGAQFLEPTLGKEHDCPPPCTLVCQHQGGLVVARSPSTPNTVAVSSADGLEYMPTASNSFDVPSNQSGAVTAIASDDADRLAVFKERAYYDIEGDIDGGNFNVVIANEGDFGITSQASLVRANAELWGLSKNGFVVIKSGFLDAYRFDEVNARILNQSYQFAWATAVNDYFNRQYICTIPQTSGEPVAFTLDYSRLRAASEDQKYKTLERSYTTKIDQAGGCAMIGDTLFHLSQTSPYGVFRRLRRFNSDSPSGNGNGDSFIDNTGAISYILESQPINFSEPGQLKSPIRLRLWSLPNDYVVEGWVPFSVLVETGASPFATYIAGTNGTSSTVSFASSTDFFKDVKLVKCRAHFYIIRLTTNTIRTAPFLTGYEVLFAENYQKEDFLG